MSSEKPQTYVMIPMGEYERVNIDYDDIRSLQSSNKALQDEVERLESKVTALRSSRNSVEALYYTCENALKELQDTVESQKADAQEWKSLKSCLCDNDVASYEDVIKLIRNLEIEAREWEKAVRKKKGYAQSVERDAGEWRSLQSCFLGLDLGSYEKVRDYINSLLSDVESYKESAELWKSRYDTFTVSEHYRELKSDAEKWRNAGEILQGMANKDSQLCKDAELGRMVRKMSEGSSLSALPMGLFVFNVNDEASAYGNTPEEALKAAGIE